MNWTLFCSTFFLIFLAELGDKTQLAVMSQSGANAGFKLTVFAAGVLALAASTAIGVLAGDVLQKLIPDERVIKVVGGVLFLLFGILMLRDGFVKTRVPLAATAPQPVRSVLGRLVLRQAATFERAAFNDYQALMAQADSPRLRELFGRIAAEEEAHRHLMDRMEVEAGEEAMQLEPLPAAEELIHDVAVANGGLKTESDRALLTHAIAHEQATAAFYRALEKGSAIVSLRNAFAQAAADEERHAAMMQALLNG